VELCINRVSTHDVIGTFGTLKWDEDSAPFALCCEDPWLDNKAWVSCIPAGRYLARRVDSPRFGDTFEITKVEGRTNILFHKGNTHLNTNGCVLVGEQFLFLGGIPAIGSSMSGYREFMRRLEGSDSFNVRIVWSQYER